MSQETSEQIQDAADAWNGYNSKKRQLEKLLYPLYVDYLKFMSEHGQIGSYEEDFQIIFNLTFSHSPLQVLTFEEIGAPNRRREIPVAYFSDPEGWKEQKLKDIATEQKAEDARILSRKRALYERLKQELGEG